MSTVSHDASLRDTQRALAIMILAVGVLGAVTILSVPFSIGLYVLQAWALRVLRRAESTLPR